MGLSFFLSFFLLVAVSSANLQLVEFNTDNYDDLQSYIKIIEEKGITARHIFPPNTVIFEMYQRTDKLFENDLSVSQTYSSQEFGLNKLNMNNKVHEVFKNLVQPKMTSIETFSEFPLTGCVEYGPSPDSLNRTKEIQTSYSNSLTGQYLIGSIAVGIYLMESTGSGENWWAAAEQITFNEIVEGLNWLSEQALSRGNRVVWVYAPVEKISTDDEPITGAKIPRYDFSELSWIFDWADDIFNSLGYPDEWDGAFGLANGLRSLYQTEWAVEIAVVMDENDTDHLFSDGSSAHVMNSWYGSGGRTPLVVLTYNNGNWQPENMHLVAAHEVGHIFGASDEYLNSDCDCGVGDSFLGTANGNCETCNANAIDCIMNHNDTNLCDYSAHELGWRDSYDSDGASDPIDPNSGRWLFINGVSPGNLIRLYNSGSGQFANLISVTENNIYKSGVFWSGITWQNNIAALGYYNVTKNGITLPRSELRATTNFSFSITNHSYSSSNIAISHNSAFNFRHTIYDSLGEVYSRPQFDKSIFASTTFNTDITGYEDGIYTSEVFGWLGDGRNTNTSTLQFINYICGDIDNSGSDDIDVSDLVYLVDFIFNNGADPVHPLSADLVCIGGFGADITDLIFMVDFLYTGGPAPECCHSL